MKAKIVGKLKDDGTVQIFGSTYKFSPDSIKEQEKNPINFEMSWEQVENYWYDPNLSESDLSKPLNIWERNPKLPSSIQGYKDAGYKDANRIAKIYANAPMDVKKLFLKEYVSLEEQQLLGKTFAYSYEDERRPGLDWIYRGFIVRVEAELLSEDEKMLLVIEAVMKREGRFNKLKRLAELEERIKSADRREVIPSEVQMFVWQRDNGKCVKCGSNEKLEFDHIIPIAKGGSNTERNLQLLCEQCNRAKSDSIGSLK